MSASGLFEARLARMRGVMASHVERGAVAGIVTALYRHGEERVDVFGDLALGGPPIRRDGIFRIASMTKPVAAAATMILVEEGRLRLDDPVDRWLPEMADRRVLQTIEAPLDDTVPAARPITLRDLLTFRLGIGMTMAPPGTYPIQRAIAEAGLAAGPVPPALPPDEMIAAYGRLPLMYQPGERWPCQHGYDILGVLIARAAGMPLPEFLAERIFAPLGMRDTGFSLPPEKRDRLAGCLRLDRRLRHHEALRPARGDGRRPDGAAPLRRGGHGAARRLRHARLPGDRRLTGPRRGGTGATASAAVP